MTSDVLSGEAERRDNVVHFSFPTDYSFTNVVKEVRHMSDTQQS